VKAMDEDDTLSADLVLSSKEIFDEFKQRCEEAAMKHDVRLPELTETTTALCRMLDRELGQPKKSNGR
jgi:hypothetical protein